MWYEYGRLVIAGLEDTLARLLSDGTSEDIINLVRNSQPEYQGHYINQLLRNPSLSKYDLTSGVIEAMDRQKSNVLPPTPFEIQISNMFLPNQKQWPLVYLKKLRANQIDNRNFTYRGFDGGTPEDQIWNINTIFRQIADWARVVQTEDPRFQIAAYDFSQALNLSNEWHNMMAGKGSDKYYIPYQRDEHGNITDERVVYQFDDGWHISQLVNENDLTVEGNLMSHCVGSYCHEVNSGESRIFSLRDPRNQPTVTIEMKGQDNIIKQIKAHSDAMPERELRLRLAEWFGSDYFEGDSARFEGNNDSWDGPDWSGIYSAEDVRSNIYEEAYGHIPYDEENTSADYHHDYGVEGQENDFSREIINLDVPDLLNSVEEAMIGVGARREGIFEREKKYPSYSGVDEVFDALAEVIIAHDKETMSQLLSHDKTNSGRWHRDIYNAETGKWNIERVRDNLGVFDLTSKYRDSYEEELEDTELPKKDDGTVDYEDLSNEYDWKFKIYYNTLKRVYEQISPEMIEQYKQLTGRDLINDIYADSSGGLSGVWQRYNDTVQPKLMKHRDDFPKGYEPRDESGNIDESVFDEAGWKYSKFKGWYRTA